MEIRPMQRKDLSQLADLYRQFWGEESNLEIMNRQFDRLAADDTHLLLCAVEGEHLLGSVTGILCEDLYGDCRPFLLVENMVVDQNCRRKGIGRLLLAALEKQAKRRSCVQMLRVTEAARQDACAFYEAYGFQRDHKGYKKRID